MSVSTDRIGVTAFRAATLLSDEAVDRTGGGKFVEVYPRATLYRLRVDPSLEALRTAASWLDLGDCEDLCAANRHCFDAVVASLTARAAALGVCEPVPSEDVDAARREGWIALPHALLLPAG